jgi:hypothetical protein
MMFKKVFINEEGRIIASHSKDSLAEYPELTAYLIDKDNIDDDGNYDPVNLLSVPRKCIVNDMWKRIIAMGKFNTIKAEITPEEDELLDSVNIIMEDHPDFALVQAFIDRTELTQSEANTALWGVS